MLTLINNRINKTTKLIKEEQADALVIFNQANYRFLTNFSGEEAELILTANGDRVLLSDSRFKDQIRHQAPGEMKVSYANNGRGARNCQAIEAVRCKKCFS